MDGPRLWVDRMRGEEGAARVSGLVTGWMALPISTVRRRDDA